MTDKPFFSWREAVLESNLHATTRHVLLTLACHMNDLGAGCFPSTRTLEKQTGLSRRTVETHLAVARRVGWITVERRGDSGQGWRRHEYRIAWPADVAKDVPHVSDETGKGVLQAVESRDVDVGKHVPPVDPRRGDNENSEVAKDLPHPNAEVGKHVPQVNPERGENGDGNVANQLPLSTSKSTSTRTPARQTRSSVSDRFHLFWEVYPRKVAKQDAIRAFEKLDPDTSLLTAMLNALRMQKGSPEWAKDHGQFVPYPATWIRGRRWEDEIESLKGSLTQAELHRLKAERHAKN